MPNPLTYQPRTVKPQPLRSEFDQSYDTARALWLRRRFLWYVGLSIVFTIPGFLSSCEKPATPSERVFDDPFINLSLGLFLALYAVAFVWAWRSRRKYRETIRLATVLFLIGGIWSLLLARGFLRPMIEIGVSNVLSEATPEVAPKPPPLTMESFDAPVPPIVTLPPMSRLEADRTDRADRSPSLATNPEGQRRNVRQKTRSRDESITIHFGPTLIDPSKPITPQASSAIATGVQLSTWLIMAGLLLLNHLLICLFIPWKVRESIVPSVLVVVVALGVLVLDVVSQPAPPLLVLASILLLLASFIPGTLVCWWRFSRFNKSFKLNYESRRFRQFERELEGARSIHESVLPAPRRDGPLRLEYVYEPMRQIGGDMLFVHNQPNSNVLHVLILDVTGHGIAAALTVNRVMGEIERSFAENPDADPEQIIRNLNRYIHLTLARHAIFVTAIAMRIDPNQHTIQYVNAGHPTAFLVRADQSRQRLETTSMLLGAVDGSEFELHSKRFDFHVGDTLIAYTDGASEATNDDGEMLYIEGVEKIITGVARHNTDRAIWPAAILDAVVHHRNKTPSDDTLITTIYRA